ncbi:MAG: hemerythrin domain-containing protein [Phycisphaeraceae bacterium]
MIFPTTGTTLSQLVRRCAPAAKLLTQLGIDWRTHRHATLAEAAAHAGVEPRAVLEVMLAADVPRRPPSSRDWHSAPLEDLADHVVATHHTYLRQVMPRISLLIEKAVRDHGEQHAELRAIREVFAEFREEMQRYLVNEEEVLFPLIRQLAMAQKHRGMFAGTVDQSVADVRAEYRTADAALARLRELTRELHPSPDASTSYRALIEELRQLERDMQRHEQLEKEVLFPRAMAVEEALMRESG